MQGSRQQLGKAATNKSNDYSGKQNSWWFSVFLHFEYFTFIVLNHKTKRKERACIWASWSPSFPLQTVFLAPGFTSCPCRCLYLSDPLPPPHGKRLQLFPAELKCSLRILHNTMLQAVPNQWNTSAVPNYACSLALFSVPWVRPNPAAQTCDPGERPSFILVLPNSALRWWESSAIQLGMDPALG